MWLIFALIFPVILCVPRGDERFDTGAQRITRDWNPGVPQYSVAAAHCGHDGDLRTIRHARHESAGVADVLIAYEDVDVLADLILLIEYSIPDPRIGIPKCGKCFGNALA
jgi:hypothetical protein